MSTLTKPYTFSAGAYAVASQVNADFDVLYNWVNGGGAMWNDGSVAFTVPPSGPATDPTSGNQLTRKSYVDARLGSSLQGGAFQTIGQTSLRICGANSVVNLSSTADVTIPFAAWFDTANPVIITSPGGTAGGLAAVEIAVINTSGGKATGFDVRGYSFNGTRISGSVAINWLAIGN